MKMAEKEREKMLKLLELSERYDFWIDEERMKHVSVESIEQKCILKEIDKKFKTAARKI